MKKMMKRIWNGMVRTTDHRPPSATHQPSATRHHPLPIVGTFSSPFSNRWKLLRTGVMLVSLLSGIPFANAQYSGQLRGPVNLDNGNTGDNFFGASNVSPTQNGNIRYQWRGNGAGNGTAWIGFEWDSRTRQFSFYDNPTFNLNNDVIIRGDMDIGGSAYGWGGIGNFGLSGVENNKQYILNITDTGEDSPDENRPTGRSSCRDDQRPCDAK